MSIGSALFSLIINILAPIFFLLMLTSFLIGINRILTTYNREKYSIIPFLTLTVTSFTWIIYGIEMEEIVLYISNLVGFIVGVVGAIVYHHYSMYPPSTIHYLIAFVLLFTALLLYSLHWIVTLGSMAMMLSVALYGSPLVTVFTVIADANTNSMSFPLAITSFISAVVWTLYGSYVAQDIWIVIPSILGIVLISIQFFLFFIYGLNTHETWPTTFHHMYSPISSVVQNAMHPPPPARSAPEKQPMLWGGNKPSNRNQVPNAKMFDLESYHADDDNGRPVRESKSSSAYPTVDKEQKK